jgi:hypothetical protein
MYSSEYRAADAVPRFRGRFGMVRYDGSSTFGVFVAYISTLSNTMHDTSSREVTIIRDVKRISGTHII